MRLSLKVFSKSISGHAVKVSIIVVKVIFFKIQDSFINFPSCNYCTIVLKSKSSNPITFLNSLLNQSSMSDRYDSKEAEPRILKFWEDNQVFKFNPKAKGELYSIDTPPPTVSGKMHIGHAFSYTQMDFVARYKRLKRFNVFYPFGTDDNGLPTQRLIEKEKKVRAVDLGREKFRKLCLETLKNELRPKFISDWKKIGMSCDFTAFYTTMDDHSRRISQKSFIELYKLGREYRKEAPAMFCPTCKTAISQVECEDKEFDSTFNDVIFKIDNKDITIATTRPELLPACVAVFYNPEDKRYKNLKGKKATVPLFNLEVPVLADDKVDPEKGSGIVMCCTFGDMADMDWQKAYNLPIKMAISPLGKMTELAGKYKGLRIKEARKEIINDLKEQNLLTNQKPIKHFVNVHERCGTEIEFIHSKQWFIKYLDLKKEMLDWGKIPKWFPAHMRNRYDNWVKGLQWDWCISRQIYFGVPFPVWYCKKCDDIILADEKDLPVDPLNDSPPIKECPKCKSKEFTPEKDIINTWATSSLTPQIAASLFPKEFNKLYPMSLRPQAHDIISFWLFNTIVKSQLQFKKNPWKDVMISGWALDPKGRKMSKSKGNVIEPQVMIEKYSADALRYWSAGSTLGEDLPFQEKDLITGQKFINKLWNASKFVFMHLENAKELSKPSEILDKWILSRLSETIKEATAFFDIYEYAKAKHLIEKFFWQDFCDNYLELVKVRLYEPKSVAQKQSAQAALQECISSLLTLFAPFTSFITEEIYQKYIKKEKSVHLTTWPESKTLDKKALEIGNEVIQILAAVRKAKSENKLSMKAPVKELSIESTLDLSQALDDLKATTAAEHIDLEKGKELKINIVL